MTGHNTQDTILFDAVRASAAAEGSTLVPVKVYLVAEVIDSDGSEALWSYNTNMTAWGMLGLLEAERTRILLLLESYFLNNEPDQL